MGRKATEREGYSKSRGQSLLAEAVAEAYPLGLVKQDVTLRRYVDRDLGYPWRILEHEYGCSLGRLDADVLLLGGDTAFFEYHGRQHFEFVQHFHGDRSGWLAAQERDNQKIWLSQRLDIPLVVFRDGETPTADEVRRRLEAERAGMEALGGYLPCPRCGRRFLPEDMEGGCPDCRREDRLAASRERASAASGRVVTEEERQRARLIRQQERQRARELAASIAEDPERKARLAAARERQRNAARATRREQAQRPLSPEAEARRAAEAGRRREQGREARQQAKAAARADGSAEAARQAARERRQAAVRREPTPEEAARQQARKDEAKASRKEAADRYRDSEAGQRAKEDARLRRKDAYQAAKASRRARKDSQG